MVRLSWPVLVASFLVVKGLALPQRASIGHAHVSGEGVVKGAFFLERESNHACEIASKSLMKRGFVLRYTLRSDIFHGLSVQYTANGNISMEAIIAGFEGVKLFGPVHSLPGLVKDEAEDELHHDPKLEILLGTQGKGKSLAAEKPEDNVNRERKFLREPRQQFQELHGRANQNDWAHALTQADKLHKAGFTGSGIKVAVIDTGVDYKHSALGGCFGQGCRVILGENFSDEGDKKDPIDCHGHGTGVASVLAGNDPTGEYFGAVPNATILAYRVLDCGAEKVTEDTLAAAWLQALNDGAQIIVSSTGFQGQSWANALAATVVSRIVAKGIPCFIGSGNDQGNGLFNIMNPGTGRNTMSISSVDSGENIAARSSFGPNWELDLKPQLVAPGQSVRVARRGGGYGTDSGTSFAGPLAAGICALVAEVRGTFDPQILNGVMMSTAKLLQEPSENGSYIPAIEQGAGLVQGWEAAHATTLIEPASLAFNDTAYRVDTISMRITNTAKTEVTYHFSNIGANTIYALREDRKTIQTFFQGVPQIEAEAAIRISMNSLTISAGQSANVSVSASDPTGLDVDRLPVWSGFIRIQGSDGKNFTVPYVGLAGQVHMSDPMDYEVDDEDGPSDPASDYQIILPSPVNGQRPGQFASIHRAKEGVLLHDELKPMELRFPLNIASPDIRASLQPVDICSTSMDSATSTVLPCVPAELVKEERFAGKSMGLLAGFPRRYAGVTRVGTRISVTGELASGQYVPPGRYKLVMEVLRNRGSDEWVIRRTKVFQLVYRHNIIGEEKLI